MLTEHSKGRVAVFIDAANLLYSQKTLGWSVDFKKLFVYLSIVKPVFVYYYFAVKNAEEKKFLDKLITFGYVLKTKPLKMIRQRGRRRKVIWKGNLDIELAYDLLINERLFDTCILFSGDSDFEIILKHLINNGHKIIVISTKGHVSRELLKISDVFIDLKTLKKKVSRKTHPLGLKPQGTAVTRL